MQLICPKNKKHKRFTVTAHEVHDWVVDEKNEFVKDLGCSEMSHRPQSGDLFTCKTCGVTAHVR